MQSACQLFKIIRNNLPIIAKVFYLSLLLLSFFGQKIDALCFKACYILHKYYTDKLAIFCTALSHLGNIANPWLIIIDKSFPQVRFFADQCPNFAKRCPRSVFDTHFWYHKLAKLPSGNLQRKTNPQTLWSDRVIWVIFWMVWGMINVSDGSGAFWTPKQCDRTQAS